MVKDLQNKKTGILDRSIFGDRIFAELLYEDNKMTIEEYTTYKTLLNNMLEHVNNPDVLVYIDCDLNTLLERINIRNREMELNVPKNYWERLNNKYNNWYDNYDKSRKIKIDGKSYNPDNEDDIENICNKIIKKIRYDM
jgi:deoxyadenosine/deoxycytidine kinase